MYNRTKPLRMVCTAEMNLKKNIMESNISIVQSNNGKRVGVAGGNYRIIVSGNDTDGSYAVIEMIVPPGGGPPPHSHPQTQEMFYILEGELLFKTETGNTLVKKDGFVNIPFGGAIHCFNNTSDKNVRLLCTVVPAGLEKIFEELGVPVQLGEFAPIPEMSQELKDRLKELDLKYGQKTYVHDIFD